MLSLALLLCATSFAQIKTPAASPSAKLMQTVGLTDVEIEYSRPSAKGRTIFAADGLVPYGKVWRTGANSISKITFSDDVMVEGNKVPAGSYGILSIPGASDWAVHFYTYEKGSWSSYVEKTPALVVNVKSMMTKSMTETFTMNIANVTSKGAELQISWANVVVPVKMSVMVDDRVMAAIDKTMAGPSNNDYYAAASYYLDAGKDMKKALTWIQKATNVEKPKFWQVRKEALIQAELGNTKAAIKTAKKSLELSKIAGNDDYVKMNEDSIKEWSMKK